MAVTETSVISEDSYLCDICQPEVTYLFLYSNKYSHIAVIIMEAQQM